MPVARDWDAQLNPVYKILDPLECWPWVATVTHVHSVSDADESRSVCCADDVDDDAVEWRHQLLDPWPRAAGRHAVVGPWQRRTVRRARAVLPACRCRRRVDRVWWHRLVPDARAQRHASSGRDEQEEQLRKRLSGRLLQVNPRNISLQNIRIPLLILTVHIVHILFLTTM